MLNGTADDFGDARISKPTMAPLHLVCAMLMQQTDLAGLQDKRTWLTGFIDEEHRAAPGIRL
jgi:hypothetical protein